MLVWFSLVCAFQAQNHIVGESISPAPSAAKEKKTEDNVEGSAPAAGDGAEDGVEAEDDDEDEIDLMDVFFLMKVKARRKLQNLKPKEPELKSRPKENKQ